jgi:hypothetical protein
MNVPVSRREKEMLKALAQQEKQATRLRHREATAGPRDDLDIEWEELLAAQQHAAEGCAWPPLCPAVQHFYRPSARSTRVVSRAGK